jgi:hypothetical protein
VAKINLYGVCRGVVRSPRLFIFRRSQATSVVVSHYIERSIEFVIIIKVGAGTEAVGLFESIHLFVYKLIQGVISKLILTSNGTRHDEQFFYVPFFPNRQFCLAFPPPIN